MAEMRDEITIKQEKFAVVYIETTNASEAYRQAYDVGEDTLPGTIWTEASLLLSNPKVRQRVDELKAHHRKAHEITIDGLTHMYKTAYDMGKTTEQSSAMTTAVTGIAKLHGLIVEKKKIEGNLTIEGIKSELFGDDK